MHKLGTLLAGTVADSERSAVVKGQSNAAEKLSDESHSYYSAGVMCTIKACKVTKQKFQQAKSLAWACLMQWLHWIKCIGSNALDSSTLRQCKA